MGPGVDLLHYPSFSGMTGAWLLKTLQGIFGASLIALYLGEDLVVDGGGNVTSWPSRIGGYTLTNSTANRFRTGTTNGRRALAPGTIAEAKSLKTATATAIQTLVAVAEGTPAVSSYEMIAAASSNPSVSGTLTRDTLLGTWYQLANFLHYTAGLLNNNVPTSGINVLESQHITTNAQTGLMVGGHEGANRTWPVPIALVMALSSPMTSLQRARSLIALKLYHGIAILPQEWFAADIIEALGSHLNSFYTVDDAVLNGSNQVVSIPARTAGAASLTEYGTGMFETRLRGARRVAYAPNRTVDTGLYGFPAVSPLVHSALAVGAMVSLPAPDYQTLYRGAASASNLITLNSGQSNWYPGPSHSIDSQSPVSSAVCSSGLHLFGGWIPGTAVGDSPMWGGDNNGTGGRNWTDDLACVMQLKTRVADLPAATFQRVLDLCKAYYSGYWGA